MTQTNQLIVYTEIIIVCCENYTEHTNVLCERNAQFFIVRKVAHTIISRENKQYALTLRT